MLSIKMSDLKFQEIKAVIITAITKGDNFYGYRYTYPDGKVKVMMLNKPTKSLMTPETLVNTTNQLIGGNLPLEYFFPPEIGQLGIPYAKVFRDDIKIEKQYIKEVILNTPSINRYWLAKYVSYDKYPNLMVRNGTAFCITEMIKINCAIVVGLNYFNGLVDSSMTYLIMNYGSYLPIESQYGDLSITNSMTRSLYLSDMDSAYIVRLRCIDFRSRSIVDSKRSIDGILNYYATGNMLTRVNFEQNYRKTIDNFSVIIKNDLVTYIDAFGARAYIAPGMRFTQYLDFLPYGDNLSSLIKVPKDILHQTSMLESKVIGPFVLGADAITRETQNGVFTNYGTNVKSFITPEGNREGIVTVKYSLNSRLDWTYWSDGKEMTFDQYLLHIKRQVSNYQQMFSTVTGSSQINPLLDIVAAYTDNPLTDLSNYLESLKPTTPSSISEEIDKILAQIKTADKVGKE